MSLPKLTTTQLIATALGHLGNAFNGHLEVRIDECASKLADTWYTDPEVQKYIKEHGLESLVSTLQQAVTEESIKEAREMLLKWSQVAPRAYKRQKEVVEAISKWPLSAQADSVRKAVQEAQHKYTSLTDDGWKAVLITTPE